MQSATYATLACMLIVTLGSCAAPDGEDSGADLNPVEKFADADAPSTFAFDSIAFTGPWGYAKKENADRSYPIVVSGCWGEGASQYASVAKRYPAFVVDWQKNGEADGASLADWIDGAIKAGYRVDADRVYLTGFSMGGSGSFPLARGMYSKKKYFAAIIRVAGQSESDLGNDIAKKTAVWYHIGLDDTETRVAVARAALGKFRAYPYYEGAAETKESDEIADLARTTVTLARSGVPMFKYSEYAGMGHDPSPCYRDDALFPWLFSHSLADR